MTDDTAMFVACAQRATQLYDLPDGSHVELLNVSENGTFAITTPDGARTALRVHRTGYHDEAAIYSELAWTADLTARGVVQTPAPLPGRDGALVQRAVLDDGQWRYVVRFTWAQGHEPREEGLVGNFETLGAITARLHDHARTWSAPKDFTRFVWNYDTSIGDRGLWGRWQDGLGVGEAELTILTRLQAALKERLAAFGSGPDRFGLVHADMRLANLLVTDQAVSVIDFDDCGFSWFLYDLGSSLSFIEHEPYVPDLVEAWCRGYRQVGQLSSADEAMLPTFIMLRRLLLVAWVGSHAETETAQELGVAFTTGSCDLAEAYLSGRYLS